jgi:DNA-binding XRE family transcriptional regulator
VDVSLLLSLRQRKEEVLLLLFRKKVGLWLHKAVFRKNHWIMDSRKSIFYWTFLGKLKENIYLCSQKLIITNFMNLREVIKERRGVLGISQIDLAEMAGISLATVKDIERGAGNPSMKTVMRILEVLGLEMEFHIRSIK